MFKVSPFNYPSQYEHAGHCVRYVGLFEAICQGGPDVGALLINGARVGVDDLFSGPLLPHGAYVLVPRLTRRFLRGHGFELVAVNLANRECTVLTPFHEMVLPKEVVGGDVIYFTDLENSEERRVHLPAVLR